MTRIAELQKKYPTIPQSVIVRWDVWNHGVRDNEDLYKIGKWKRSSSVLYQSEDHDMTLKDVLDNRPDRVKPGFIRTPPRNFYMKNGMGCKIDRDSRSDYEIRDLGGGKVALFEEEEKVDVDIYFPPRPALKKNEPVTSRENPISHFFSYPCGLSPHCFRITPLRHCEYFASGDQCRYCNLNGTKEDARSIGLSPTPTVNLAEAVEAYKIHSSQVRLLHCFMVGGGLMSAEKEANLYTKFVEGIAGGAPYKIHVGACFQAVERKSLERLKDAGLDSVAIHLEVWGKEMFEEVCPGKAKHMPYERWLEALENAVDIFGVGSVISSFVGGVTLIPENGHKTWQEALDSMDEGFRWLTKTGVWPIITNAYVPPGSVYGDVKSNRDKLPSTEFYLDACLSHHKAMKEHSLYEKLNKFGKCGLCHDGAYKGEIGMLALAGDMGNWMADIVPFEMNNRLQFIASLKSPTSAYLD